MPLHIVGAYLLYSIVLQMSAVSTHNEAITMYLFFSWSESFYVSDQYSRN